MTTKHTDTELVRVEKGELPAFPCCGECGSDDVVYARTVTDADPEVGYYEEIGLWRCMDCGNISEAE